MERMDGIEIQKMIKTSKCGSHDSIHEDGNDHDDIVVDSEGDDEDDDDGKALSLQGLGLCRFGCEWWRVEGILSALSLVGRHSRCLVLRLEV